MKLSRLDRLNDPFELLGYATKTPAERAAWSNVKSGLAKFGGILCFSANWHNPVQWSHYADRHAGLCLGFDVPDHLLEKVCYQRQRLAWDDSMLAAIDAESDEAHEMMRALVKTKFRHWQYEREYRLFAKLKDPDKQGRCFVNFDSDLLLREIIVGAESAITRAEIDKALGKQRDRVSTTKARLAFKTFSIVEQRLKNQWS
ncbi:DUF2971 domain-containing protein [Bosea sp. OK403]|uniref:DUF2971 domain-containing protein n=1 Tax=Bosea sp. OK403 TaxID=1855286 RepID=UPI001AECDF71|nr:DUF2971 domain-containing protein [Bosea sp. OK403]